MFKLITFKTSLLLTLLLFAGCKTNKIPTVAGKSSTFMVGSYNVRYAAAEDEKTGNNWNKRIKPMVNLITAYHMDIVGTQEANAKQLEDMQPLLDEYAYIANPYGGKTGTAHHTAIFYKKSLFEPIDQGVFWLSPTPDTASFGWDATDRRICQWAKFKHKISKKEFYFFNAHFYWKGHVAKENSGPLIVRKIKEVAGKHAVILVGDLNSESKTTQMAAIREILKDVIEVDKEAMQKGEGTAFPGGVFKGIPNGRIDYIYTSPHFSPLNYKVIADQYEGDRYPSDHLPIISEVSW